MAYIRMPAAHLGRARCSLSLNATVPELPVICRDTWPSGCRFEYEPGIWLRMGTTDREVQSTVRRDYMGLLLSFGKNANIRTILDAGANVGLSTRLFASSHPDAQVVALEAQAGNYAMARLNTERHQNVVVVHAALSDRDDQTMRIGAGPRRGYGAQYQYVARPIASDSLGGGAGAGAAAVGGMQAVGVTVGRLLEELCLPSFDFVKLVRGAPRGRTPFALAASCCAVLISPDSLAGYRRVRGARAGR